MSILEFNGSADLAAQSRERSSLQKRGASRLAAMVLLGGDLRASAFKSAIGRSPLDLPIDSHHCILDLWQAHGAILVAQARLERLSIRVITNGTRPTVRPESLSVAVSVESDPFELRGPGGVLRDVASAYDDDDLIAVASANQILMDSLSQLLATLEGAGADVAILSHDDGTPGGLMLARCGSLRVIPSKGYVDLKEQALPEIAEHSTVKVVKRDEWAALPVRTHEDYISALRRYHHRFAADRSGVGDQGEDWAPAFSLRERGSHVDPTARLHDAVVLRGGRVERGAVVARSVVCPGAVVRRGEVVVDRFVSVEPALDPVW